jgi:hypothetical protein
MVTVSAFLLIRLRPQVPKGLIFYLPAQTVSAFVFYILNAGLNTFFAALLSESSSYAYEIRR